MGRAGWGRELVHGTLLDLGAEGRLCSEPRDLVATWHCFFGVGKLSAASCVHLYASSIRKLTLFMLCFRGLFALIPPQLLQSGEVAPAQAAKGPQTV